MVVKVVVIVASIAFVAEVGSTEESVERTASVVVIVFFDETYDLGRGYGSCVDEHVGWIDGYDFELVTG